MSLSSTLVIRNCLPDRLGIAGTLASMVKRLSHHSHKVKFWDRNPMPAPERDRKMRLYKVKRKVFCGYPDITNSYICVASNMVEAFEFRKELCFDGELDDVCFEELAYNMDGPARILSSSCSACRSH